MREALKGLTLSETELDEFRQKSPSKIRINWRKFDEIIDETELIIMRFIWNKCLTENNVIAALSALRDVFFLNRGDLYLNLFHEIERNESENFVNFEKILSLMPEKSNLKFAGKLNLKNMRENLKNAENKILQYAGKLKKMWQKYN